MALLNTLIKKGVPAELTWNSGTYFIYVLDGRTLRMRKPNETTMTECSTDEYIIFGDKWELKPSIATVLEKHRWIKPVDCISRFLKDDGSGKCVDFGRDSKVTPEILEAAILAINKGDVNGQIT